MKRTAELGTLFKSESKRISTYILRRELRGLRLNRCLALREPIIIEVDWKKQDYSLQGTIKIVLWNNGRRSWGLKSPEWWTDGGMKGGRWSAVPIMPGPSCWTVLWPVVAAVGQVQVQQQNVLKGWGQLTSWISWMVIPPMYFFSSRVTRHIPKWQCQDSSGSRCERVVLEAWGISFTPGGAPTEPRPSDCAESLRGVLQKAVHRGQTLLTTNARSWWENVSTMDENKSCDFAEASGNSAAANVCCNQSYSRSSKKLWPFFCFSGDLFWPASLFATCQLSLRHLCWTLIWSLLQLWWKVVRSFTGTHRVVEPVSGQEKLVFAVTR